MLLRGLGDAEHQGRWDPEAMLGHHGRLGVAGVAGFGLGGMSATFAGWATALALLAAVAGAIALGVLAVGLRPQSEGGD